VIGGLFNRLWGCGDLDRLFGTADRTVTPWPRGGKLKYGENFDRNAVTALLASPVGLIDIDPREVWCSQPWLLREHVDYYRTGRWELSGRTSADQLAEHNRFPIIVRDYRDRLLVVAGHHRTAAALIEGRRVRARVAILDSSFHVTPLLTVDQTPAGRRSSWKRSAYCEVWRRLLPPCASLQMCSSGRVCRTMRHLWQWTWHAGGCR
jgi:hypothetical protein